MQPALLDTDILSELLKQKNTSVLQNATTYLAQYQRFSISAVTRYEVLRGLKDKKATRQLKSFETFCQNAEVIAIDDAILDRASDLWAEGRRRTAPPRPRFDHRRHGVAESSRARHRKHAPLQLDSGIRYRRLAAAIVAQS
jgi:predicted nucleic acid-binding protein